MSDLSQTELEAIYNVIEPPAIQKREPLKEPAYPKEEKRVRAAPPTLSKAQLSQFQDNAPSDHVLLSQEAMENVRLRLDVVLGRSDISLAKLLELKSGTTLALNKLAGEPVDIELNGQIVAKGEIVVVDDSYGIQITQLYTQKT